jgi:hypothetical protein
MGDLGRAWCGLADWLACSPMDVLLRRMLHDYVMLGHGRSPFATAAWLHGLHGAPCVSCSHDACGPSSQQVQFWHGSVTHVHTNMGCRRLCRMSHLLFLHLKSVDMGQRRCNACMGMAHDMHLQASGEASAWLSAGQGIRSSARAASCAADSEVAGATW